LGAIATKIGFAHVRSGPLVRSSYHAGESDPDAVASVV
jgi:lipoic acid synthetase